jgi:hypothetical protein
MSRTALCVFLLCAFASTGAAARESHMAGPGSGGGNTSQQCQDDEIQAAVDEATPKTAKPRAPVTTAPRKPAKAVPSARSESDVSRLPTPRWHSFLPGMFR